MRSQSAHWRLVGLSVIAVVFFAVGATYVAYLHDIQTILERKSSESRVVQTRHGPVEFSTWGTGPTVLVLHGAGGGYDQGSLIAQAFVGEGYHWIAPSRFGYLRSPLPADASTPAQADALAELLDELNIDSVAILAMSGGVPPALQFALRFPERTSALALLSSAPYTPLTAADQELPIPIWLYQALFSSELPYWVLQKVARSSLETIFDVKPDLRAALTNEEKAFVAGMVSAFVPVTRRTDGLRNERAAINPQTEYPLADITAPTLVIHARDDGINPFAYGEYTAQHIPSSDFMPLMTGGHLLLGHQAEIETRVNALFREYGSPENH